MIAAEFLTGAVVGFLVGLIIGAGGMFAFIAWVEHEGRAA